MHACLILVVDDISIIFIACTSNIGLRNIEYDIELSN